MKKKQLRFFVVLLGEKACHAFPSLEAANANVQLMKRLGSTAWVEARS